MNGKKILSMACFFCFVWISQSASAENISFKFSYNINTVMKGDISTWTDSFNSLWQDWQSSKGGTLDGRFNGIEYGYNYEFEIRVPIFSGFALNLGASQLRSNTEGTVVFDHTGGVQSETHFIRNIVTAWPLKVGFSYCFRPPIFSNLSICFGGGRLIVFGKYETAERYDSVFQEQGSQFNYWYERTNTYSSDALGLYVTAALEYAVFKNFALLLEVEQKWAKMDGFKGPYTYQDYLEINDETGKASLYFYESDQWGLGKHYSVLSGHRKRPENGEVRNVRQGELNFGGYSFKVGFRIIF